MGTKRLEVRLDSERENRLRELAEQRHAAVSEVVRQIIDEAFEELMKERRREAAIRIGQMEIEDVPDPEELSRQLAEAHDPGVD